MPGNPLTFTETQHTEVTPAIDPSEVSLPAGFTVCILGASRGIGASIAYAYARAGASKLVLAARSVGGLEIVATECKKLRPEIGVVCEPCDIASNESVEALAKRLKEQVQRLDVIVVNSGFAGPVVTEVTDGDPADWKTCLEVNTLGTYHAAHHLLPILLKSEGARSFLVVSSAAVTLNQGIIANVQYCVSKLAQLRIVEMMAKQYQSQGLLTLGIHPGAVATEMAQGAPDAFKAYLIDSVDLCGAFCVWLSKDAKAISWLSGRFISATWDAEQLVAKKDEIVENDSLKFELCL